MTRWVFRWGPAVLIMGIIFVASSTSGSDLPDLGYADFLLKKGGHLLAYAMLGAAFLHGFCNGGPSARSVIFTAIILVILYAVSDEWHQSFIPGRNPALLDICIDIAGGFLGVTCLHFLRKRFVHMRGEANPSSEL